MRCIGVGRRFRAIWKCCLAGASLLESVVCVKENVFFLCRMFFSGFRREIRVCLKYCVGIVCVRSVLEYIQGQARVQ